MTRLRARGLLLECCSWVVPHLRLGTGSDRAAWSADPGEGVDPESRAVRGRAGDLRPSRAPVPVQVTGTSVVTTGPESVVTARAARQVWEYRDVRVAAGQDLVVALTAAGQDGWEATGIAFQSAGQTVIVVKRPR